MFSPKWLATALAVAVTLGVGRPAEAAFLALEFNTHGDLPSATPGVFLYNNTGFAESSLYSVSGGFLRQQTFALNGNASYAYPNLAETGGPFSPTQTIVLESRIRVSQIVGTGAYFQAFDGSFNMAVFLTSSGVTLPTATGDVAIRVDVFAFHTYRLEASANTRLLSFTIDGSLVFSGSAAPYSGLNGLDFGDGLTAAGNGANADYDFLSVSNDVPATATPLPATALVFALGAALVAARSRRLTRGPAA